MIYHSIKHYCDDLITQFGDIPENRKLILNKLSDYIQLKLDQQQKIQLLYVCTHNSRRSHLGQIWSITAAHYYGLTEIATYSGGTEATAFYAKAIQTLVQTGFHIKADDMNKQNPKYTVRFGDNNEESTVCFSKVYNDMANPKYDFIAIMTCSDAEQNCPLIPGGDLRIATTYDDPKIYDNTDLADIKYNERSRQIALECLYVFSRIKKQSI